MWVMTSFGVLMPSVRPEGTVPEGDDRLIQVRARRMRELRILKAEYLPELGPIVEIPYSDYEYRAYCTHAQWAAALAKISMDIDYTKFKPTTETKYQDRQLHSLYNRIWSVFFSEISTREHQDRYLYGPGGKPKIGRRRKAGTSRWTSSFTSVRVEDDDAPTLASLINQRFNVRNDDPNRFTDEMVTEYGITQDDIARLAPDTWDDELPTISRRPDGTIDHSYCSHASSRNARRRCRNANKNS